MDALRVELLQARGKLLPTRSTPKQSYEAGFSALAAESEEDSADRSLGGQEFTFVKPDPQLLQWDSTFEFEGNNYLGGWLNASLWFYDEVVDELAPSPRVCLRVWGLPSREQPAKSGPLFSHTGGPSATVDAILAPTDSFDRPLGDVRGQFDLLSINQRGINMEGELYDAGMPGDIDNASACPFRQANGEPAHEYPVAACNEIARKSNELCGSSVSNGTNSLLTIASCQAFNAWAAEVLPGFTEDMDLNQIVTDVEDDPLWWTNETKVRWHYRLHKLNSNLCFAADRFQLTGPRGRTYNTFNYLGTTHLANDIDLLRQAVGSPKMSLVGFSYGTTVGAAYATLFPDHIDRLLIDGNCNPSPDIVAMLETDAQGAWTVWNGLAQACDASLQQGLAPSQVCPLAPNCTEKVLKMIDAGGDVGAQAFDLVQEAIFASWISPALPMSQLSVLANGQELPEDDFDDDGDDDKRRRRQLRCAQRVPGGHVLRHAGGCNPRSRRSGAPGRGRPRFAVGAVPGSIPHGNRTRSRLRGHDRHLACDSAPTASAGVRAYQGVDRG